MDSSDKIYENVKDISDDICVENLLSIVLKVMQLTEKLQSDGQTKKKITIEVINKLIENSKIENKDKFLEIARMAVPPMIDCLVDLDRGKIAIKIAEKTRSCIEYMCI